MTMTMTMTMSTKTFHPLFLLLISLIVVTLGCECGKHSHCFKATVGVEFPDVSQPYNITLPLGSSGQWITLLGIDNELGIIDKFFASVPIRSIGDLSFSPPITYYMGEEGITPVPGKLDSLEICWNAALIINMCCSPTAHFYKKYSWALSFLPPPTCTEIDLCTNKTIPLNQYIKLDRTPNDIDVHVEGEISISNPDCCTALINGVTATIDDTPLMVTCGSASLPVNLTAKTELLCTYKMLLPTGQHPSGPVVIEVTTAPSAFCQVQGAVLSKSFSWNEGTTKGDCAAISIAASVTDSDNVITLTGTPEEPICDASALPPIELTVAVLDFGEKPVKIDMSVTPVEVPSEAQSGSFDVGICGINPGHVDVALDPMAAAFDWQFKWSMVAKDIPNCTSGPICGDTIIQLSDLFAVQVAHEEVNYRIAGNFTIANTFCLDANISDIVITIGEVPMTVVCPTPLPFVLPASIGLVECAFSGVFPEGKPASAIHVAIVSETPEVLGTIYDEPNATIAWTLDKKLDTQVDLTIATTTEGVTIDNPTQTLIADDMDQVTMNQTVSAHVIQKVVGPTLITFEATLSDGSPALALPVNFCGIPGQMTLAMIGDLTATFDQKYAWTMEAKPLPDAFNRTVCDAEGVDVVLTDYFDVIQTATKLNYQISGTFEVTNPACIPVDLCGMVVMIDNITVKEFPADPVTTIPANSSMQFSFDAAFGDVAPAGSLIIQVKSCTAEMKGIDFVLDPPIDDTTWKPSVIGIDQCMNLSVAALAEVPGVTIIQIDNSSQTQICAPSELSAIVIHATLTAIGPTAVPFSVKMDWTTPQELNMTLVFLGTNPDYVNIEVVCSDIIASFVRKYTWGVTAKPSNESCAVQGDLCQATSFDIADMFELSSTPVDSDFVISQTQFQVTNPSCIPVTLTAVTVSIGEIQVPNVSCEAMEIASNQTVTCSFGGPIGNEMPVENLTITVATAPTIEYSEGCPLNWVPSVIDDTVDVVISSSIATIENGEQTVAVGDIMESVMATVVPTAKDPVPVTFTLALTGKSTNVTQSIDLPIGVCGNPGQLQVEVTEINATYDTLYTWAFIPVEQNCTEAAPCDQQGIDVKLTDYFAIVQNSSKVGYKMSSTFVVRNPECIPVSVCGITVMIGDLVVKEFPVDPATLIAANESAQFTFEGVFGLTPPAGALTIMVKSCTPEITDLNFTDATPIDENTWKASEVVTGQCMSLTVIPTVAPEGAAIVGEILNSSQANICKEDDLVDIIAHIILSASTAVVPFKASMDNDQTLDFAVQLCGTAPSTMIIKDLVLSNGVHHVAYDWDFAVNPPQPGHCVNHTGGPATACLSAFIDVQRLARMNESFFAIDGAFSVSNPDPYCSAVISAISVTMGEVALTFECQGDISQPLPPAAALACTFVTPPLPEVPTGSIVVTVTATNASLVLGDTKSIDLPATNDTTAWTLQPVGECVFIGIPPLTNTTEKICDESDHFCINVTESQTNDTQLSCFNYPVSIWSLDGQTVLEDQTVQVCFCPLTFGCVYGKNFWKRNCKKWPAEYLNKTFFNSEHTWPQVFEHKASICYWKLAQQWVTAKLNIANGASHHTPELNAALDALNDWFEAQTTTGACAQAKCTPEIIQWYNTVLSYNQGTLEVPRCNPCTLC